MNNKYTPSFNSMGIREQMKNIKESTSSEITEQTLKEYLLDIFSNKIKKSDREFKIMVWGYEDENNKVHCKALEEFDKAMKEEVNKQENKLKDNGNT